MSYSKRSLHEERSTVVEEGAIKDRKHRRIIKETIKESKKTEKIKRMQNIIVPSAL